MSGKGSKGRGGAPQRPMMEAGGLVVRAGDVCQSKRAQAKRRDNSQILPMVNVRKTKHFSNATRSDAGKERAAVSLNWIDLYVCRKRRVAGSKFQTNGSRLRQRRVI
jgi:hypothetical protein